MQYLVRKSEKTFLGPFILNAERLAMKYLFVKTHIVKTYRMVRDK